MFVPMWVIHTCMQCTQAFLCQHYLLLVATKHFQVKDRTCTCTQKKKGEACNLRLQRELRAVSSRCHRWWKSTVTPSRAFTSRRGRGGLKRLARLCSHLGSSPLLIHSATVPPAGETADWDIFSPSALNESTALAYTDSYMIMFYSFEWSS